MTRMSLAVVLMAALLSSELCAQNNPRPPASALVSQGLDTPVKLELKTTLPEAMRTIGEQTGVRLEADPVVWDLLPWGQQTNITAKIENQTLRQALEAIARKLGLAFEVRDDGVELVPMPALRRLGRRATLAELQILDTLSSTPLDAGTDRMSVRQLLDAIEARLKAINSPFAVEYRPSESAKPEQALSVPRNVTLAEALEAISTQTGATWYPAGKSLLVVAKEEPIRNQLSRTLSARYNGVELSQVLAELSRHAGVDFEIQPGAIQQVPADYRTVILRLDNTSVKQALDTIAGFTGLGWVVSPRGVYIWNQSSTPAQRRDPIVGIITLPDIGMQVMVPQSQVSPEMRQYLQHKMRKELDKLRQMMKEEGFVPATQPAGNQDL